MKCPVCEEENSTPTVVWYDRNQYLVCEDCCMLALFTYWGA